jgi:SAM-dependent methyltransferase
MNAAQPYESLALFYDRWMSGTPYERWRDFVHARFAEARIPVRDVLDLCCGTGTMTRMLSGYGYRVAGLDGSPAMLAVARDRTPPGTELIHAVLPALGAIRADSFDGVMCSADSLNYLLEEGQFSDAVRMVAEGLRPGGVFVFDLTTQYALETAAGSGDDQGDLAYLWRTRYDSETARCDYLISLFVPENDLYRRVFECHTQRWFTQEEVRGALAAAGFRVVSVTDDYGGLPAGDQTYRETWVAEFIG